MNFTKAGRLFFYFGIALMAIVILDELFRTITTDGVIPLSWLSTFIYTVFACIFLASMLTALGDKHSPFK